MKWTLAVLLAAVAACGGGNSETPEERLIGQWVYTNSSGSTGIDVTFNTNATYTLQVMRLTSTTSANDQVETGIYSATENELTFTPQKYTCPGPVPVFTEGYSFNGDSLSMLFSDAVLVYSRSTTPAATNFSISFGCFQTDGSFVQAPLAAVSN